MWSPIRCWCSAPHSVSGYGIRASRIAVRFLYVEGLYAYLYADWLASALRCL
jgi:hypothetical protein